MDYSPPPEIPKAVIECAKNHTAADIKKVLYHAKNLDNYNIYIIRFYGKLDKEKEFVDAPMTIIYDGKTAHPATREELSRLWIYETPKYFPTSEEQIYRFDNKD